MSDLSFDQRFPPVYSSKPLGWQGIEAGRYLVSPGNISVKQGLSTHLLMLYLGEPGMMVQTGSTSVRDGFLRKGEHALVPAESLLSGSWPMDVDIFFLRFDPAWMRSLVEASAIETNQIKLLSHSFLHDPIVEQFGLALLHEMFSSGFNTRLYAESLASALALHLLRHYSTLQPDALNITSDLSKTRLRQVLDYMYEYYTQDLSVAELAAVAHMSASHFAQLFRKTMGVAPHEYLLTCRIEHAKRLLLTEDSSLHEIASRSGFADQSHFTRHFQRRVGVTPGMLRKDRRNAL